jgi:hypothetical protein
MLLHFAGALVVQNDVARRFLSGWLRAGDCDQGCGAASFPGRRARAGSKPDRTGVCSQRSGEVRPAGTARSRGARHDHARGEACARGNTANQSGNPIDRSGDGQIGQSGDSQEDRGAALARCQRQPDPGRAAASASQKQRTDIKRRHIPAKQKSRGLALPTGRRGRSSKVIGPLAKVQFVERFD